MESTHNCGCHKELDADCSEVELRQLQQRIADCPGCYSRYEIEQEIRAIVRRCCQSDSAPSELRERISLQIRVERRK